MEVRREVLTAVLLLLLGSCKPGVGAEDSASRRSAVAALTASSSSLDGYARADAPRVFTFPADHGPHDDFQTEWWYVTGNLEADDGRRFGFQWTLFRRALAPPGEGLDERPSRWATRQLYMGHFALTDVAAGEHRAFERFARGAAGLAGATSEPFAVWLESWGLASVDESSFWPLALSADAGGIRLALELAEGKPRVLQGEQGLSRKNALPGGASYYYSYTRLPASGRLQIGEDDLAVTGTVWIDREWSTSVLAADQVGWDWFALQLDDGRDLMVYHLRRADGGVDRFSSGVLVESAAEGEAGTLRRLEVDDFELTVLARWRSPRSGIEYPSRWRLQVRDEQLDLEIEPLVADQELAVSFRYWEGAVAVRGEGITGQGYVELVGYGD